MKTIRPYSFLVGLLGLVLLAVGLSSPLAAADAVTTTTVATATPWYANSELIGAVIALVGGLFGIWRNSQAKTSAKVAESLILAIEEASKVPEVASVKATIRAKATELGIQPVLHKLVQELTADDETSEKASS